MKKERGAWSQIQYEQILQRDESQGYSFAGYQKIMSLLYDVVQRQRARKVLCIGAEHCAWIPDMVNAGIEVTGVDASAQVLADMQKHIPAAEFIVQQRKEKLPDALKTRVFDSVLCTYALHGMEDAEKITLIRDAFARVSPGGILAIGDIAFATRADEQTYEKQGEAEENCAFVYEEIETKLGLPSSYIQVTPCAGGLLLQKPRMVLFDYGDTLVKEAPFNGERGAKALLTHVKSNPRFVTAAEMNAFAQETFKKLEYVREERHIEINQRIYDQFLYEYLGVTFSLTPLEVECTFFENAAPGNAVAGVAVLLDKLSAQGIRTGVISNISFSAQALSLRLRTLFPNHSFEFIMTSSEYIFRKPEKEIFELALRKARLPAEEVWFCGDSYEADIKGAAAAGICPVWYTEKERAFPAQLCVAHWEALHDCFT